VTIGGEAGGPWTCESGLTKCFLSIEPRLKSSWRGWIGQLPWLAAEVEAHYGVEKSRRNIGVRQARLGQAVAQDLVGLLLRIKGGKKLDDFLIDKPARKRRRKRRSKR